MKQVALPLVGTAGTAGGTFISFCVQAQPVLEVLSLIVTIALGILTAVWTAIKIQGHFKQK